MTGYGEASTKEGETNYFLEVRSLNSKYFKAVVRLPDEFQGLEAEIETRLRRHVTRGSLTVKCSCSSSSSAAAHQVNHLALDRYVEQLSQSEHVASGRVSIDLGALLALPGVIQEPANEEERVANARQAFLGLLDRACEGLIEMRQTEGTSLAEDLVLHRDVISDRLGLVLERSPAVIKEYENRLRQRILSLFADAGRHAEEVDLIREIASYAERTDIAEETQRLAGHVEQFTQLIENQDDSKPIGRTLDFLAQEMLREANTMASKSSDSDLSRAIVEIKGAIDRIKEQVQNVE